MTARTRKATAPAKTTEAAAPAAERPAEPMECTVRGCTDPEHDGEGVCQPHHTQGWRYVKEPSDG